MKRYISMFLLLVICFLLQTTVFVSLRISSVMPNLILVITSISGFMYGKNLGMFIGVLGGLLADLIYGEVVGINILIYTVIGYLNGSVNRIYVREDYLIPVLSIAVSDLLYGIMFYICHFLLRGRLDLFFYLRSIILPEMIYTLLVGILLFLLVKRLDNRLYPPTEVPLKAKRPLEN